MKKKQMKRGKKHTEKTKAAQTTIKVHLRGGKKINERHLLLRIYLCASYTIVYALYDGPMKPT